MRPILLAFLLTGCAMNRTPNAYEWIETGHKSEWYRWIETSHGMFPAVCGFIAPDGFNGGGACVVRVRDGVILPGDRNLYTNVRATKRSTGRVCLVLATMSEEEAKRMRDKHSERDLWSHEVVMHCKRGMNHTEVVR